MRFKPQFNCLKCYSERKKNRKAQLIFHSFLYVVTAAADHFEYRIMHIKSICNVTGSKRTKLTIDFFFLSTSSYGNIIRLELKIRILSISPEMSSTACIKAKCSHNLRYTAQCFNVQQLYSLKSH